MDSPEERLSGPVATPASPQGSDGSRGSSNSRTSLRSGRSQQQQQGQGQQLQQQQQQQQQQGTIKNGGLRRYCSTVVACLAVGVIITLGSVAMTVIGYFAVSLATRTVVTGSGSDVNATASTTPASGSTTTVLDEELRQNLFKFRTFGPVMIGFGSFLIMCACVLLCEERDKRRRGRDSQDGQTLLGEHERIMQEARQRFYNENRTALLAEAQGAPYRSTRDNHHHGDEPPATMTVESDRAGDDAGGAAPASPVVLVHGPAAVGFTGDWASQPGAAMTEEKQDEAASSPDGSPDRVPASPPNCLRTSSKAVGSAKVTDGSDNAGAASQQHQQQQQPVVASPVLPRIGAPPLDQTGRCAGGAVPKSILVPAGRLSPIRGCCGAGENGPGPVRVRLVDEAADLTPVGVSGPCRSAECLPHQARSPGRQKRGRRKRGSPAASPGSCRLDPLCRCVSDPAMVSRSPDACCCPQADCCSSLGGSCQLADAPTTAPSTPVRSGSPGPATPGAGSGVTDESPVRQPPVLVVGAANDPEPGVESTPTGAVAADDDGDQSSRQQRTARNQDPSTVAHSQREPAKDAGAPPHGVSSPDAKAKDLLTPGAGDEATVGQATPASAQAPTLLVSRDRNSNVKLFSRRPEASPGKSAPTGKTKSGVVVLNLSS